MILSIIVILRAGVNSTDVICPRNRTYDRCVTLRFAYGLFWQSVLMLDIIIYTVYAYFGRINMLACLLENRFSGHSTCVLSTVYRLKACNESL